jgi:nucleoid-associated protein YejK
MTIQKLIEQLNIRLNYLKSARISYIELNNLEIVARLDIEILETEQTIEILKNS